MSIGTRASGHYERAFAGYLRDCGIPYVSVDDARRALLPEGTCLRVTESDPDHPGQTRTRALKSFDFVVYGGSSNLLIDVKGRKIGRKAAESVQTRGRTGRLESWVTLDDIASLHAWERLFGGGFCAAFVFVYWCAEQPPGELFQEIIEHQGRWYAVRGIMLSDYTKAMKTRSPRWRTVDLRASDFDRLSRPFSARFGPCDPITGDLLETRAERLLDALGSPA